MQFDKIKDDDDELFNLFLHEFYRDVWDIEKYKSNLIEVIAKLDQLKSSTEFILLLISDRAERIRKCKITTPESNIITGEHNG